MYELDVQYFDQGNGESEFRVSVNGKLVDDWIANLQLPTTKIGGDSSTRRRVANISLHRSDEIRIDGKPDRDERASLDYIELVPKTKR